MAATEGSQVSPQRIMEMAWSFAPPLMLASAIQLRLFDLLDAGPLTLAQAASKTSASPRGLRALMDALVALNFLAKQADRYELTPESSAFLVSGKPGYRGGFFKHVMHAMIPRWLGLTESVRTGKPSLSVNQEGAGAEFFREFVEDLFGVNYPGAAALAQSLGEALKGGPSGAPVKVLDLAAGSGVWGIALARQSPAVQVTAVDWPAVAPIAQKVAARHNIGADRFQVIAGDLLQVGFGTGYCVATLGHILHSEGEARSRKLLAKVYDALAPGGTIAIAEFVADEDRTGPPQPLIFAVNMLLHTDEGDTFTFSQLTAWLREAGFKNARQLPVPAPSPLLLATKPE